MDISGLSYYVGRLVKGLTASMNIRARNSQKNKQNSKFVTTDVCLLSFTKILEEFKFVPYQEYMKKEVKKNILTFITL